MIVRLTVRLWPALVVAAVMAGAAPASAQLPSSGAKNFNAPGGVPNYFSNEAGAPPGSDGIIRPHGAPPPLAEEEVPERSKPVAARPRPTRQAAAKSKRRTTKVAAKSKRP